MTALIDCQVAYAEQDDIAARIPKTDELTAWADAVLHTLAVDDKEITIRFVAEKESWELNHQYRGKDSPTNVLSFPFECPPGVPLNLLGDLIICAPVIEAEANAQNKTVNAHYAHMVVHGILHLLGYDHIEDDEAEHMEALEVRILAQLSIDDPYQEL